VIAPEEGSETGLRRLVCKRCLHSWYPRRPQRPAVCPRCKSPRWDEPEEVPVAEACSEEEEEGLVRVFLRFLRHAPKRERDVICYWLSLWSRSEGMYSRQQHAFHNPEKESDGEHAGSAGAAHSPS